MKNIGRFHSPGRATNFHRYIKNSRTSDYDVASHARNPNHRTIPPIRRILLVIKRNDFTHVVSSIDTRGWIPVHPGWSTSPCFPSQEFPTARNIVGRARRRSNTDVAQGFYDLFGCRLPSDTRYRLLPASYVRTETTNSTTSDAPSGADLLGRRPTGREKNSSQRVEFPKEREFRLFGLTEWRRSFPSFSPPVYGNWRIKVSCCSSSNYSIINRKDRYLEKTRKRENYRESKISR